MAVDIVFNPKLEDLIKELDVFTDAVKKQGMNKALRASLKPVIGSVQSEVTKQGLIKSGKLRASIGAKFLNQRSKKRRGFHPHESAAIVGAVKTLTIVKFDERAGTDVKSKVNMRGLETLLSFGTGTARKTKKGANRGAIEKTPFIQPGVDKVDTRAGSIFYDTLQKFIDKNLGKSKRL